MKKIFSVLLTVIMLTSAAVASGPIELPDVVISHNEVLKGDINGDGSVDNKDVVLLFRFVSSENAAEYSDVYDVNNDKKINNKDVTALFRRVTET